MLGRNVHKKLNLSFSLLVSRFGVRVKIYTNKLKKMNKLLNTTVKVELKYEKSKKG